MDADSMVMKNLDHLFYLPHTPVASRHAWWPENSELPNIHYIHFAGTTYLVAP
jgi:alpha-N-acetylglucosamine transferase